MRTVLADSSLDNLKTIEWFVLHLLHRRDIIQRCSSEYGFTVYEMGVVHAWVGQVVNMCISNVSRVSSP